MSKHRTARGREFNMQAFTANQGDKIAVGNSGRNARGDLLGPGGIIIATKQEIAGAAHDQNSGPASKTVKLNPMEQEISRKEVVGADGVRRWEVTYADGSVELFVKENVVDIDRSPNLGDL
jgi:hypothetical protein